MGYNPVITPVINGISRVNPLITGVTNHLLSGMSHQVGCFLSDITGDFHEKQDVFRDSNKIQ